MLWLNLELPLESLLIIRNTQDAVSKLKRNELEEMFVMVIRQLETQKHINKQLMKEVMNLEAQANNVIK